MKQVKKASAGVGVIHNDRVKVVKESIKTARLKKSWEEGRVEKYLADLGWERNLRIYAMYGKSGGTKEAKAVTEAILEAIEEEEANGDPILPTFIQGDYNEVPSKLKTIRRMIDEHCWIDVGEVAHWWGGEANEMTCHARAGAKPSRIDGLVCNLEAATLIHSFEVEKDEMIPTHSFIKVKVSRYAMTQKRKTIRSLPSLKKAYEKKIEEDIEKIEEKEKSEDAGKS